jgi:hypothetical protein
MRIILRSVAAPLLFALVASSCGDPAGPTTIVGTYQATTLNFAPTGLPSINILGLGGSLTVTIAADNTTTGSLVIPDLTGGSPTTISLVGTAVRSGNTVTFQPTVDSPISGVPFDIDGNTLNGSVIIPGEGTAFIVLTRQ